MINRSNVSPNHKIQSTEIWTYNALCLQVNSIKAAILSRFHTEILGPTRDFEHGTIAGPNRDHKPFDKRSILSGKGSQKGYCWVDPCRGSVWKGPNLGWLTLRTDPVFEQGWTWVDPGSFGIVKGATRVTYLLASLRRKMVLMVLIGALEGPADDEAPSWP